MQKQNILPLLAIGACIPAIASNPSRPNIILILADDLGYGDVSCLNPDSKLNTPGIDAIGNNGVIFTDAHSSSSVSTPSRYGLLTGRYNWRSTLKEGVVNGYYNRPLIPKDRTTLASMLHRADYSTACIGKWHLGWEWAKADNKELENIDFSKPVKGGPCDVGFDYFFGIVASLDYPPYVWVRNDMPTTTRIGIKSGQKGMQMMRKGPIGEDLVPEQVLPTIFAKAEEYIASVSKDKPFFLYLPLSGPHTPILPTKEYKGKSGLNDYGDFVLMIDDYVARLTRKVRDLGLEDNTLIIFTSDNGCSPAAEFDSLVAMGHNPSAQFRGYKADLYDGGHRVPLLASWKGHIPVHQVDQTVCYTDFMATLASLTGVKLDDTEGVDSYDLKPLFFRKSYGKSIREATVHHSIKGAFSIRKGPWKLLMARGSAGWSYPRDKARVPEWDSLPEIQLYNLDTDCGERKNLYLENPEKVTELKNILKKYIEDGRSTKGKPQKNDSTGSWKQLSELLDLMDRY